MFELSAPWYGDRLDPDYERRPVAYYQQLLTDVGLTADFWQF